MSQQVQLDITPSTISQRAGAIATHRTAFIGHRTAIYTMVGGMANTFKGEASQRFQESMTSYEADFNAAEIALQDIVEFLNDYVIKMNTADSTHAQQIYNLPTTARR